jgi:hypothetical protein
MDFGGTGSLGLQSGFVLAVILAAIFFAERLGGSAQLAQRAFQVALGIALTLLVIGGTNAFMRAPDLPEELQGAFFQEEPPVSDAFVAEELAENGRETARNAAEVRTVHSGVGLLLIVAGLAIFARLPVVSLGGLLGGLLLLLLGGPPQAGGMNNFLDLFSTLFGTLLPGGGGDAGQARDIAHFAVLLFGTGALAVFGYWRWERERRVGLAPTA